VHCQQTLPEREIPSWPDARHFWLSKNRTTLTVASTHAARTLVEIVRWIDQQGAELEDVHLKRPSLEDVFIELTGRSLRE
jgi:ABC-2 type transport system ATP-binding protein